MSSDSSSSMFVQSPPMNASAEGQSARSRNAQAQADLRARRKAYIAELQSSNAQLDNENQVLQREKQTMQEQINTLKSQVRTLKQTMGMGGRRSSSNNNSNNEKSALGIDSLLTAVEVERKKVRRMRGAIKKLAMMEDAMASGDDTEADEEVHPSMSKRRRRARSPDGTSIASPSMACVGSIDLDQQSSSSPSHFETDSTVTTVSSHSPATPLLAAPDVAAATTTAMTSSYWPNVQPPLQRSPVGGDDSSQSALNLLLAQSAQFKQQVIQALTEDARVHYHGQSFQPEEPLCSSWHGWPHAATKGPMPGAKATQSQDDVLDRFLSAFSGPATTTIAGSKVPDSPAKRHPHSASVFLVLLLCLLGRVLTRWEEGKKGRDPGCDCGERWVAH